MGATALGAARGDGLARLRLVATLAAAALALEIVYIALASPRLAVREIQVRGDRPVAELVARQMRLPANTNLLRAPTRMLAEQAERVPAVREAAVARDFPDRLVVTVERREAVAVIRRAKRAVLIDPNGAAFSLPDEWGWGLPELVGPHLTSGESGTGAARTELSQLVAVLRALGPDPRLRATRLEVGAARGIEITLESGARVRFGEVRELEVKARILAELLDRLGAAGIEYLELSDPAAVYWRPRSAAAAVR